MPQLDSRHDPAQGDQFNYRLTNDGHVNKVSREALPTADFEALLTTTIGLDAASIGSAAIERAVQERQSALALPDRDLYWERLRDSQAEGTERWCPRRG